MKNAVSLFIAKVAGQANQSELVFAICKCKLLPHHQNRFGQISFGMYDISIFFLIYIWMDPITVSRNKVKTRKLEETNTDANETPGYVIRAHQKNLYYST